LTFTADITEELYDGINRYLDKFYGAYPDGKLLLIIDSYGNTTSLRDSDLKFSSQTQQPGGAAKVNRMGLGSIKARQTKKDLALLIVNYTYDNIGSVGKTNAGGKALNFLSMLTIQSSRKAWYERTQGGTKYRAGADVTWKTYKNHYAKALVNADGTPWLATKELVLRISDDGLKPLVKKEEK
jgi:hypothetical protein